MSTTTMEVAIVVVLAVTLSALMSLLCVSVCTSHKCHNIAMELAREST